MLFMTFAVVTLFTFLHPTSLAFQIHNAGIGLTLDHERHRITHKMRCVNTRSPHQWQHNHRDNPTRNITLRTKRRKDDEHDYEEDNKAQKKQPSTPPQQRNIFDSLVESQYFTSFLFWAPFIFNPKLRQRFANFLSEYLDLSIAVPVLAVGTVVAVIYVTYQNRLLDIQLACDTTEESLRVVREIRRAQMAGVRTIERGDGGGGSGGGDSIEREYEVALENYDYALREELKLRNTFFTLPFKIPNAPEGPDRSAAKQFLGINLDE